MRRILFVINPISGGIGKRNLQQDVQRSFRQENYSLEFHQTTGDDDITKLRQVAKDFNPDIIVACGGDGTINLVANATIDNNTTLGIIPLGSANGLATELRIPTNLEPALRLIKQGKEKAIDVLSINDRYLSLHLSDLGFNAKLIKRFEKVGKRGKLGYARQFIYTLFTQESIRYYFMLEQKSFSKRAQMVSFANARKYGTGAVINPDGKLDDGKFEVCIFRPYPWYALFGIIIRFFTGSLKKSKYVKIYSTNEVEVNTQKPEILQVDGETVGEFNQVNVKVLPQRIRLLVP